MRQRGLDDDNDDLTGVINFCHFDPFVVNSV